ncbi:GntR family transcriptional regulator [Paenibacillus donghaensis]|uniref:Transcriptional regulator n=1 Tax=Paenibacillus donghaensis TaxID=414771 RepID=A0A2Z2KBX8_9BACL|nr:GntR family transcriptional regulator [Paenibacillus donghaensis]ASA20443.1 transcriptional regulator [Paenibacillus donghaensis]
MMKVSPKQPGENSKDYSYRVIKQNIMSLTLAPGQVISEIDLAEALQISRTPVREVIAKLKEEHLIDVIPQVGTYVSKITGQLIEEAAFMRLTLEQEILLRSSRSFPAEVLPELRRNVAQQELLLEQQGRELDFHQLDTEFHQLIFRGNRRENVWTAITRLSTHYNRMRLLSEMEHNFGEAVSQHREMLRIIELHLTEQVEPAVRQHIIEPMKDWEQLYQPGSRYAAYFDVGSPIGLA